MNPAAVVGFNSPTAAVERRRYRRYRLSNPISIHATEGAVISATTLEISEGGSAVLAAPSQVGDRGQLEKLATGTVLVEVCRQIGKVYGFEFVELTVDQTNKIREECRRLPLYPSNQTGI